MTRTLFSVTCLLAAAALTGCAASGEQAKVDPWEGYNRAIFNFNESLDQTVFKPVAKGYRYITPDPVEIAINNFFNNLFYPRTVINQALQGKFKLAVQDTGRLALNTTVGLLGFWDPATKVGLEAHDEDFGQTLAVWGVGSGPYTVLPILGPSTVRGSVGWVGDYFANPVTYIEDNETRYGLTALAMVDVRAEMLKAEELISGDKYLFIRDAYLQRRAYQINDQRPAEEDPFLKETE